MKRKLNRRTFLRSAGVAIALPTLDAMAPVRSALASGVFADEETVPQQRMIMICTSLGLHGPSLFPKTAGRDYENTPYLEYLKDHRDDFTVFSGLSHPDQSGADGHSSQMTWLTSAQNPGLGGFQNTISVDQYVREKLGYVTRFPSIALSTGGQNSQSYTGGGVMVPAEYRPSALFEKMFLEGKPHQVQRQKQKLSDGKSVLDSIAVQARRLRKRVSSADRERLEEYFTALRSAEQHFQKAEQWIDRPKPVVAAKQPEDIKDDNDLIGRTKLMFELIPLILQTDSSRVITLLIEGRSDVPPIDGVTMDHHNLSHHGQDEAKIAQLAKIETELMKSLGGLMDRLKSKKEADHRLIDNSMVLFGSNLGNANSHDWRNLPVIMAGGRFNHGSHVEFDRANNTPLSNLFVAMMQKMKLETDQFGTSSGTLSW
jgi:hypothetical protein